MRRGRGLYTLIRAGSEVHAGGVIDGEEVEWWAVAGEGAG